MIGLLLRVLVGGLPLPGAGFFAMIAGTFVACCTICGIYKCSKWRMRNCSCIKRCMRASGADQFDDFEVMVLVHEAMFTCNKVKVSTVVRITAGVQSVQTDASNKSIFQQPLAIFVEQGTETVNVELIDSRDRKVLGLLKLDPVKDILKSTNNNTEQVYNMKQKNKGVLNPRVKLTIHLDREDDVEKALLSGVNISTEADLMLRQQLQKAIATGSDEIAPRGELSQLEVLARGCCGPLDMFGSWGSRETVYVAVRGPPDQRKYTLGVFKDEQEFQRGWKPSTEVDLLKVVSVQPDPGRTDVFLVNYVLSEKVTKRFTFRRIDRARDVWVEMLTLMIKMIREEKEQKRMTMTHTATMS